MRISNIVLRKHLPLSIRMHLEYMHACMLSNLQLTNIAMHCRNNWLGYLILRPVEYVHRGNRPDQNTFSLKNFSVQSETWKYKNQIYLVYNLVIILPLSIFFYFLQNHYLNFPNKILFLFLCIN